MIWLTIPVGISSHSARLPHDRLSPCKVKCSMPALLQASTCCFRGIVIAPSLAVGLAKTHCDVLGRLESSACTWRVIGITRTSSTLSLSVIRFQSQSMCSHFKLNTSFSRAPVSRMTCKQADTVPLASDLTALNQAANCSRSSFDLSERLTNLSPLRRLGLAQTLVPRVLAAPRQKGLQATPR